MNKTIPFQNRYNVLINFENRDKLEWPTKLKELLAARIGDFFTRGAYSVEYEAPNIFYTNI